MLFRWPDGLWTASCATCLASSQGIAGERADVIAVLSEGEDAWELEGGGGNCWCTRCSSERRRPRFRLNGRGQERRWRRGRA